MILPETGPEDVTHVAERLRTEVEAFEYPGLAGQKLRVTISLGKKSAKN